MRTNSGTTIVAKFVTILLVAALLLTAFVVAPRASGQQAQFTSSKILFGQTWPTQGINI